MVLKWPAGRTQNTKILHWSLGGGALEVTGHGGERTHWRWVRSIVLGELIAVHFFTFSCSPRNIGVKEFMFMGCATKSRTNELLPSNDTPIHDTYGTIHLLISPNHPPSGECHEKTRSPRLWAFCTVNLGRPSCRHLANHPSAIRLRGFGTVTR